MFYSQKVAVPQLENTCPRCESKFSQWSSYHKHVISLDCAKVIRPINTSGRSKAQIVEAVEIIWGNALIK